MADAAKQTIARLITRKYSPEQVCAYLAKHEGIRLHHGTIYRYLVKDRKNGGSLYPHLRIVSKPYRKKYGSGAWAKGKVPDRTGIEGRPAVVGSKECIGDFEMDTVVGKDQKAGCLSRPSGKPNSPSSARSPISKRKMLPGRRSGH